MRIEDLRPGSDTPRAPMGAADLWAAAAAADPSWDGMSGERESRGRLCQHIARLLVGMKWARIDLSWV